MDTSDNPSEITAELKTVASMHTSHKNYTTELHTPRFPWATRKKKHHICDGRFTKRNPPTQWSTKQDTTMSEVPLSLKSSRIINLEQLGKHVADVSLHAATYQS